MKTLIRFVGAILTGAFVCAAQSCDSRKPFHTMKGIVWNTTYSITYSSNVELDDSVTATMKRVEMSVSAFNDSSVVSRVNRGEDVMTDTLFRRVFAESQRINTLSRGAFDPTVGPLIELWGFGRNREAAPPSQEAIDSASLSVGMAGCYLTHDLHVVKKTPDTRFNFSAIAKGYGCDMIGDMLRRNGVNDFMVEIGGEIVVSGRNPRGTSWRIMIDAPVESADSVVHQRMAVIEPDSCCGIATSGNYRNFHEVDGMVYGHTINPFTGRPAQSEVLSVTVIAPECITADALATACMVMPLDSARAMIRSVGGASALMVTGAPDGSRTIVTTPGFPPLRH